MPQSTPARSLSGCASSASRTRRTTKTTSTVAPSRLTSWFAGCGELLVRVQVHPVGELTVYGEFVHAQNVDRSARAINPVGEEAHADTVTARVQVVF